MTCIVGYRDEKTGKVHIGGDSAGVGGYSIRLRGDQKVFIKDDKMIFGFTTSFRMGQIIQNCFTIPYHKPETPDYEYLCSTFIAALLKCYKENGYELKATNGQKRGGTFLMGYKGKLYRVEDDFQVGIPIDPFDACGCGEEYAVGALKVVEDQDISTIDKIQIGLETAEYFSAGVSSPFNFVEV